MALAPGGNVIRTVSAMVPGGLVMIAVSVNASRASVSVRRKLCSWPDSNCATVLLTSTWYSRYRPPRRSSPSDIGRRPSARIQPGVLGAVVSAERYCAESVSLTASRALS
jgi:hypothetical protein